MRRWFASAATLIVAAVVGFALTPAPLEACAPDFPNQLLLMGDEAVTHLEAANRMAELKRIAEAAGWLEGLHKPRRVHEDHAPAAETGRVERDEIKHALVGLGVDGQEIKDIDEALIEMRAQLLSNPRDAEIPAALPDEFRLYLQGAKAYRSGDQAHARERWEAVLALPRDQRAHRSIWAAYMLGRSYISSDPGMARLWMSRTRELELDGDLRDGLGLAAQSWGWEARAADNDGSPLEALKLYVIQAALGTPRGADSVRVHIDRMFGRGQIDELAADPMMHRIVTASLVSGETWRTNTAFGKAWLPAVEKAGHKNIQGADRMAWLAYRSADYKRARRWARRADGKSAIALWIRAKLALRDGRLGDAGALLRRVVKLFPTDSAHRNKARGELALLDLRRGAFSHAADALFTSGYFADGAYVAERVLTIAELERLVDKRWASPADPLAGQVRDLLARRLMRAGRFAEAVPYFSTNPAAADARAFKELQDKFEAAGASDKAKSSEILWSLAQRARQGDHLFATEVGPDWRWAGMSYDLGDTTGMRRDTSKRWRLKPSAAELRRARRHAPKFNKRWQYRYVAADYAWRAAELMPDNHGRTAGVLCTAGSWLKAKDPEAADRFYKALVRRNRSLQIATEADELRWFPSDCGL